MNNQSLLLQTCYYDCLQYYKYILRNKNALTWNYICITASNRLQAKQYEEEIRKRSLHLPSKTNFLVIPDFDDKRVGSGGATLSVLRELKEKYGCDFNKDRILIIHSGGDSKRTPQYSALGKLFSPIPHSLPNDDPSTLFDELLITTSYIPTRISGGALILSGDVLLLFNNLDFYSPKEGAAAISFKEKVATGKNHGVFYGDNGKYISSFLHKQPADVLNKIADENGDINIDTGAIYFSGKILDSLYSLVSTKDKFHYLVNDKVRLSFYGDFLYPLCKESTLENFYKEKPEGSYCDELKEARTIVWNELRQYKLILESFSMASFMHFGTSREVHDLNTIKINDFEPLGWRKITHSSIGNNDLSSYMSVVADGASIKSNVYSELSYIHKDAVVGENTIVSHIDIIDEIIPNDVVVHGLKLNNGKFVVRIFGIDDNPKENKLFGIDIASKFKELGLEYNCDSLWNADIYPECLCIRDALKQSLNLYDLFKTKGDLKAWLNCHKLSMYSSFEQADPQAIFEWRNKIDEIIQIERLYEIVRNQEPIELSNGLFKAKALTKNQREWIEEKSKVIPFVDIAKLYHYLAYAFENDNYIAEAYTFINKSILEAYKPLIRFNPHLKINQDEVLVRMPLRINFAGGWTDTPPYCNEHGGVVLNTAIKLNGELPVSVSLKKISEHKVILKSDDMDAYYEFTNRDELQDTGNPFDSFALQKAVLIACGVVPKTGGNLDEILGRIGGGFIMQSEVTNVPKGSGLGTSSILSACCVQAVSDFFGLNLSKEDITSTVICVEQIMSTGGGWQDQVGGLYPGVKLISSKPGVTQDLTISELELSESTIDELNDRLVLISTGQRRLARNLLRSVISRYLSNNKDSLYALHDIKRLAFEMQDALQKGDIDLFGKLLDEHWKYSKMIDRGSSNELIEQIFASIDDLICGRMVVGAGGGGFLQVVLKQEVKKEQLRERIDNVFKNTNIQVFDQSIYK